MNTFYDQFQRCMRHPQQRSVGVCSSCLQERLTSLIQPPSASPPNARKSSNGHAHAIAPHAQLPAHANEPSTLSHANVPNVVKHGIAETAPRSNGTAPGKVTMYMQTGSTSTMLPPSHEDMRKLRAQSARHARRSADFANAASYSNQNDHIRIDAKEALVSPCMKSRASHAQPHQSNASVSSKGDALGKKKASWFSVSKPKSSLHTASIQVDDRKVSKYALKSPQHISASVGSSSDTYRHVRVTDLEAIAEVNMGDTTSKIQNHISREAGMSISWISSLFHRRKGPRSRSNLSNSSGSSITNMDAAASHGNVFNESNRHSPKNSIDGGRLSWDGGRPNLKQLLKRIEARSKQQRADFSPLQFADYAAKEYNDNGRMVTNQAPYLQKSKSVASARSSISVEMPKELMQSSYSPMIHQGQSNVMVGLDYDSCYEDRNLRRSRSWGRTWNRALSPLWGSRSHRHKGTHDSPSSTHQNNHFHMGLVTPNHASLKGGATPASSSYLSPLRRSRLAPDARIRLAH